MLSRAKKLRKELNTRTNDQSVHSEC